jgi:hypothetical protein
VSENNERRQAIQAFSQFIEDHSAPQARHADYTADHLPTVETVVVDRSEVLNVFFELQPQHAKHRDDVSQFFSAEPFVLSKNDWQGTVSQLRAVEPP